VKWEISGGIFPAISGKNNSDFPENFRRKNSGNFTAIYFVEDKKICSEIGTNIWKAFNTGSPCRQHLH